MTVQTNTKFQKPGVEHHAKTQLRPSLSFPSLFFDWFSKKTILHRVPYVPNLTYTTCESQLTSFCGAELVQFNTTLRSKGGNFFFLKKTKTKPLFLLLTLILGCSYVSFSHSAGPDLPTAYHTPPLFLSFCLPDLISWVRSYASVKDGLTVIQSLDSFDGFRMSYNLT